ncbi:hypothetical protein [Rhizobium sp. LjRoot258]|uniref:hypothetical protein n=1 Tax=Rhizobium sp. LjRoot258 TaxID=3342299 RepID=UPI003ECCA1CF
MPVSLKAYSVASARYDAKQHIGCFLLLVEGEEPQAVTVTRRGLLNAGSPPRATAERFFENLEIFCEIARQKVPSKRFFPTVFVTAEDVRRWTGFRPATGTSPSLALAEATA